MGTLAQCCQLFKVFKRTQELEFVKKMNFANFKRLVQSYFKNMDEPNKTHLGAIFAPQATSLQPLIYIFVSLIWRLSHFISLRAVITFPTLVCILRFQESHQLAVRVSKCASEWIFSSRNGLVCHSSQWKFIWGPPGDSFSTLIVRSWRESIFWQLIIILGILYLQVLVCWLLKQGAK